MTFEALEQYLQAESKRKYALLGARQGEWDAALADCTERNGGLCNIILPA